MSGTGVRYATRSASTGDKAKILSHHAKDAFEDALDQVKVEVSKVCSVNEGTQKKITTLMRYLDEAPTEVSLAIISSYTCTAIHNSEHSGD